MDIAPGSSPGPQISSPDLAPGSRGPGVDPPENDARLGVGIPSGAPPATVTEAPGSSPGPQLLYQIGD